MWCAPDTEHPELIKRCVEAAKWHLGSRIGTVPLLIWFIIIIFIGLEALSSTLSWTNSVFALHGAGSERNFVLEDMVAFLFWTSFLHGAIGFYFVFNRSGKWMSDDMWYQNCPTLDRVLWYMEWTITRDIVLEHEGIDIWYDAKVEVCQNRDDDHLTVTYKAATKL